MSSASLLDAHPALGYAYMDLSLEYARANPGKTLLLTCTYRSPAEQQALYAQGRSAPGQIVTQLDGVTHFSNHNCKPARAVDVCVLIGGKVSWDPAAYAPLGPLAIKYGLVWGGSWPHFKDYPHLELPKEKERA
jgi:peptidoglycan L-alanyl-D-glutamate endopeptidase CwlK